MLRGPALWGSIPAGAGETVSQVAKPESVEVDPRGCGGDAVANSMESGRYGRSPRVRGRPSFVMSRTSLKRSIPAGAGETERWGGQHRACEVDPRGCGGDLT